MQNQMNHHQAKNDFENIAQMQLSDMKQLYERRLRQYEEDKQMLQKRNSGQAEHISELVRKYKEL